MDEKDFSLEEERENENHFLPKKFNFFCFLPWQNPYIAVY